MEILKFSTWQSSVNIGFWQQLSTKKLEELKLSEEPLEISGSFCCSRHRSVSSHLELDGSAFRADDLAGHQGYSNVSGTLYNVNTLEGFRDFDRKKAVKKVAEVLWKNISSGESVDNPSLLSTFLLITYADLKTYQYHYWFAFPALKPPSPFTAAPPKTLEEAMGEEQAAKILRACDTWRSSGSTAPFWIMKNSCEENPECVHLRSWETDCSENDMLCVSDPSHLSGHPGWMLRNCLFLIAHRWHRRSTTVLCIRERQGSLDALASLILDVPLPEIPKEWGQNDIDFVPGWEVNADGKKASRFMDMRSQFDPRQLSEEAVNLNLRLMLWRAAPNLDTKIVAESKCLLLGMGTLGCMVARTLMGWGVTNLTFVDSGKVSFSNPVRQSLYEFEDCLEGGKDKAKCAAEHLGKILPTMSACGLDFAIPMPGHPPRNSEEAAQQKQAAGTLQNLISSHDAVFLLTDTRESRWLPTLICASLGKIAIDIALGFDSFLVMRHGGKAITDDGKKLGCYFCNDVVAPLNSVANRALDQQCTVARPGLAPIASALGVEMMVALLQHPLGVNAPAMDSLLAPQTSEETSVTGAFGDVPHMIRGDLFGFSNTCMEGQNYSQCTACSPLVVKGYEEDPWGFVEKAILDPKSLEDLTGLTALKEEMKKRLLPDDDRDDDGSNAASDDWMTL